MTALPDLFGDLPPRTVSDSPWARRKVQKAPPSRTCPKTGHRLWCDCGRPAVIGRGAIVRRGIVGTWTCGRAECAPAREAAE